MELLKVFYFLAVGIYVLQRSYVPVFKYQWVVILLSVFLHAYYFFGFNGILFLLVAAVITTIAEVVSLTTQFNIFGVSYKYNLSAKFFPSKIAIAGVYPIDVTAAWMMLKYLSFFMVGFIFSGIPINGVVKAAVTAFALVSFDFLIDPIAIHIDAWRWKKPGIFFGIPWTNFLGWFIIGFIVSLVFYSLDPIRNYEPIMVIPVFIVWATFPWVIGREVIKMDKVKGILANIPVVSFLVLGIIKLLV